MAFAIDAPHAMFPLYSNNPTQRTPVATYALVAINLLVFVWMSRCPRGEQKCDPSAGVGPRGSLSRQPRGLRADRTPSTSRSGSGSCRSAGARTGARAAADLAVAADLHVSPRQLDALIGEHVVPVAVRQNVEDRLGPLPYLLLYLAGGLVASRSHWAVDPISTTPVIGASGAIAAVLGAYAVAWPLRGCAC